MSMMTQNYFFDWKYDKNTIKDIYKKSSKIPCSCCMSMLNETFLGKKYTQEIFRKCACNFSTLCTFLQLVLLHKIPI